MDGNGRLARSSAGEELQAFYRHDLNRFRPQDVRIFNFGAWRGACAQLVLRAWCPDCVLSRAYTTRAPRHTVAGVGEDSRGNLVAHPDEVWVKFSFDSAEPWTVVPMPRVSGASIRPPLDSRYDLEPEPLSAELVADLRKLVPLLPERAQAWWQENVLAGAASASGSDDDSSDSDWSE